MKEEVDQKIWDQRREEFISLRRLLEQGCPGLSEHYAKAKEIWYDGPARGLVSPEHLRILLKAKKEVEGLSESDKQAAHLLEQETEITWAFYDIADRIKGELREARDHFAVQGYSRIAAELHERLVDLCCDLHPPYGSVLDDSPSIRIQRKRAEEMIEQHAKADYDARELGRKRVWEIEAYELDVYLQSLPDADPEMQEHCRFACAYLPLPIDKVRECVRGLAEIRDLFEQQGFSDVANRFDFGRQVLYSNIPAVRDELQVESKGERVSEHLRMLKG